MADHTVSAIHMAALRQRLLQDIKEVQQNPYPGIKLHLRDGDFTKACLVLAPAGEAPLHLTVDFPSHYPIDPPDIKIQSKVSHPNVFGDYICISMLSCDTGYTRAYTLKAICLQMLSFFASDTIDQMGFSEHGGRVDRKEWKNWNLDCMGLPVTKDNFKCRACSFDAGAAVEEDPSPEPAPLAALESESLPISSIQAIDIRDASASIETIAQTAVDGKKKIPLELVGLPQEILLIICEHLDDEPLFLAARAWNGFGRLIRHHNIIRTRELQCFMLKRGFKDLSLGIGVHVDSTRAISSEFDIISDIAFFQHHVRSSIQGLCYEHWLPLPLSHKHWAWVKDRAAIGLDGIARRAGISGTLDTVLYSFMNNVVVKLCKDVEAVWNWRDMFSGDGSSVKSTLTHASEKAVESYFHLFHLLLCHATALPNIVDAAQQLINKFTNGDRDKRTVPNLGYLLIAILITDVELTDTLIKAIIKEAVIRNVVWMLEAPPRGKGFPELSFLETSAISSYRLQKTFEAGKTSYRLLMFLNLMRKVVRKARNKKAADGTTEVRMTLVELRDSLFKTHGAPPAGAASSIAKAIREIQAIDCFPDFLRNMSTAVPSQSFFTTWLRACVEDSMSRGYSKWALTQEAALRLRFGCA